MMSDTETTFPNASIFPYRLRHPNHQDGYAIHQLIARSPPLDTNSLYCNYLQTIHFQETSILAENEQGNLMGFISGYRHPQKNHCLFIWQVAIHPSARGVGLPGAMLTELLNRETSSSITAIETTISSGNQASWAVFHKLDRLHGNQGTVSCFLDQNEHFQNEHDTEWLYHIPVSHSLL